MIDPQKLGVEVELLAFYHLTQAFEVINVQGEPVAHCVDDITLQSTLEKSTKPRAGWYRILSNDVRLLRLIMQHTDASDSIENSLTKLAELFGVAAEATEGGVYRVADKSGAPIALAAPLPGERERPCELMTMPLAIHDGDSLTTFLSCAETLQFQVPEEGATHLHFDGVAFANVHSFLATTRFFHKYRLVLRRLLRTNLNCRRLGDWPHDFLELIKTDALMDLSWDDCRQRLASTTINKYCDFNLRNLIYDVQDKHTLEIRILPSTLDAAYIVRSVRLFRAIFAYLSKVGTVEYALTLEPSFKAMGRLLEKLELSESDEVIWGKNFQDRYEASQAASRLAS